MDPDKFGAPYICFHHVNFKLFYISLATHLSLVKEYQVYFPVLFYSPQFVVIDYLSLLFSLYIIVRCIYCTFIFLFQSLEN